MPPKLRPANPEFAPEKLRDMKLLLGARIPDAAPLNERPLNDGELNERPPNDGELNERPPP
jgi:hypothetical protein